MSELLRNLDVLSQPPILLTYGDPSNSKQRDLHKTKCGGFCSIIFMTISVAILVYFPLRIGNDEASTKTVTTVDVARNFS